jgi:hypothetical protein
MLAVGRSFALRSQELESIWSERLSAAQAAAAQQLDQAQQRHSLELAKAAETAAFQAAEAEARWVEPHARNKWFLSGSGQGGL